MGAHARTHTHLCFVWAHTHTHTHAYTYVFCHLPQLLQLDTSNLDSVVNAADEIKSRYAHHIVGSFFP